MTFADRYSFAIISAAAILERKEMDLANLAEKFYNDTYLMDQNACSSPHLICWMGEENEIKTASERFWFQVYQKVNRAGLHNLNSGTKQLNSPLNGIVSVSFPSKETESFSGAVSNASTLIFTSPVS